MEKPERVEKEEKSKLDKSEERLTSDVWLKVTLKNGARIEGLARGGVLFEKLDRGRFVPARAEADSSAGLRLYFADFNDGYVFLRRSEIRKIDSNEPLTASDQRQIQAQVKKRQVESGSAPASTTPVAGAANLPGGKAAAAAAADAKEARRKEIFAKFNPIEGWGPSRRDEILKKRWTVGVFPDQLEREFLDNYDDWSIEFESYVEQTAKTDSAKPQPEVSGEKKSDAPPEVEDEKGSGTGENAGAHGALDETRSGKRSDVPADRSDEPRPRGE